MRSARCSPSWTAAEICQRADVPLVLDATAALGRIELADAGGWSVLTGWAGAFGGPASVGILVIKKNARWRAPYPTDDYQGGRWPGVPDVPAIYAGAVALDCWQRAGPTIGRHQRQLIDQLRAGIAQQVPDVDVAGDPVRRVPHLLTFSVLYVDGETLTLELDKAGIAVASGSACSASSEHPSHVLAAMGALTHGNVRIGLTWTTTDAEIDRFLAVLPPIVPGSEQPWAPHERGRSALRRIVTGLSRYEMPAADHRNCASHRRGWCRRRRGVAGRRPSRGPRSCRVVPDARTNTRHERSATLSGTTRVLKQHESPPVRRGFVLFQISVRSVEAVAAGARARGIRVVDGEALLLDGVDEVDSGAHQVRSAHPVGHDIHTAKHLDDVAFKSAIVKEQLVTQTRATAWLHSHAKRKIFATFAFQEGLDLGRSPVGQDDAVCYDRGVEGLFGCRHACQSKGAPLACPSCFQRVPRHQLQERATRRAVVASSSSLTSPARPVECGLAHRVRRLDTHGAHFTGSDQHFAGDHDARTQRVRRSFGHCCDDSTTAAGEVERRTARHHEVQAAQRRPARWARTAREPVRYSTGRRGQAPRTQGRRKLRRHAHVACGPAASLAKASSAASVRSISSGCHAGLATSSSGDAAQTQQQLVTLRGWHHADQLGLTQPGSGLREIQLAEPNETVDSFVERAIADCAERGQQTGSGVMDPQAGQIYDEFRRRFSARLTRRWPPRSAGTSVRTGFPCLDRSRGPEPDPCLTPRQTSR